MPLFTIRLNSINAIVTRSVFSDGRKSSDTDVITFIVLLNQQVIGKGAATFDPVFGKMDALLFPPATGSGMNSKWQVRDIEIGPNDGLTIVYTGTNISGGKIDVSQEQLAQLEIKALDSLVSAAVGAVGGPITSAIGSVLGLIGDPIGQLLGFHTTPNCDGLVFSDTIQFTGAGLLKLPFERPDPSDPTVASTAKEAIIVRSYTDAPTHDTSKCGPEAQTEVRFSIVLNPDPVGGRIVWHNGLTEETQIWLTDGERVRRRRTVVDQAGTPAFVGPPWRIAGTTRPGDEGRWEIVWHNSLSNETQIWFMNDERIARRATVLGEDGSPAFVGPPWAIVGAANVDFKGSPDIVWHNGLTGETQIWFMNDERVARRGTVVNHTDHTPLFVGPPWRIVGIGEFAIVWHNSLTNETQFWGMNEERAFIGETVVSEDGSPALVGPPWRIVGIGDVKGSGHGANDIVWHNALTNETQIWFLQQTRISRRATVVGEDGSPAFVGPPWRITGRGEASCDGQGAIVWHNSDTNDTQLWFMNGAQIKARGGVVDEHGANIQIAPPWRIVAATGFADESAIIWHHGETNDTQFWFMNGAQIKARGGVVDEHGDNIQIGPPWRIVAATGLASESAIIWHNSDTNDTQFWFMNGAQIKARGGVVDEHGDNIQIGPPWSITGANGN
jgi:hypothetical protein